jgi:hypothetical protein
MGHHVLLVGVRRLIEDSRDHRDLLPVLAT